MIYVGIDPGKDGGFVAVSADGAEVLTACITPTIFVGKGGKRDYDITAMRALIANLSAKHDLFVTIEAQQAMPKQGVTSMFSLGYGFGLWVGLVHGLPHQVVKPAAWKKEMLDGLPGKDKGADIIAAERLLPALELTPGRRKKPHDGLADAGLLALYGLRIRAGLRANEALSP